MTDRQRRGMRSALVWEQLSAALDRQTGATGRTCLDIVDVGGGSGAFAVALAERGHRVTVVDPSPNALAALERRAADAGLGHEVAGVQGDAAGLVSAVGAAVADVVLCHGVLELVDDPAAAVAGLVAAVRADGLVSVVVAQRYAAVLSRALAGHLADARVVLDDEHGRWGDSDPLPRRFDEAEIGALLDAAGLTPSSVHGTRFLADLVPGALMDDPASTTALAELEARAQDHPALRPIAAGLHVLAARTR